MQGATEAHINNPASKKVRDDLLIVSFTSLKTGQRQYFVIFDTSAVLIFVNMLILNLMPATRFKQVDTKDQKRPVLIYIFHSIPTSFKPGLSSEKHL